MSGRQRVYHLAFSVLSVRCAGVTGLPNGVLSEYTQTKETIPKKVLSPLVPQSSPHHSCQAPPPPTFKIIHSICLFRELTNSWEVENHPLNLFIQRVNK